MATKKQKLSQSYNWLIFRLKGARFGSAFNGTKIPDNVAVAVEDYEKARLNLVELLEYKAIRAVYYNINGVEDDN